MNFAPTQAEDKFANPNQNYANPLGVNYNNAGEQSLAKVNAHGISALDLQVERARELYDSGKVLEANNEYNRIMSEGTTELMSRKQEKALNVVEDYDKLHTKAIEEVRKKYGQFISYGKAGQAFNIYTERDNNTRRTNMLKYQMAETDAYHDTQFVNQLSACNRMVLEGNGDNASIDGAYNRGIPLIEGRYANYGKEMIEQQSRKFKNELVAGALQLAVNSEDYNRMEEIVARYKDSVDVRTLGTVVGLISKRRRKAQDLSKNEQMLKTLGYFATPEQIDAYVASHHVKPRKGEYMSKEDFFSIVGEQESGGNYEAENARTGAYGKYQIMPDNFPAWAEEAGLGADAEPTPENQERVAQFKLGQYYDRYGAEGALVAWYAGEYNGARWRDGMPTAMGEDGEYSWDARQGNGDEPSVREYVEQSLGRYGGSADTEGFDAVALAEEQKRAREWYSEQVKERRDGWQLAINEGLLEQQDLRNRGVTDPDAYDAIAEKYGIVNGVAESHILIPLQKAGGAIRNAALRADGKGGNATQRDVYAQFTVREMLEKGGYSPQEVIQWITSQEVPFSNTNKLLDMVMDYQQNKGEFAIDWNTLKNRVKTAVAADMVDDDFDSKFALSRNYASDIYRDYMNDHGEKPTQEEMYSWLLDGMFHPSFTTEENTLWWDKVDSRLSNAELYDRGIYDAEFDMGEGKFRVKLANGEYYYLTKDQYDKVVAGKSVQEVLIEDGGYSDG